VTPFQHRASVNALVSLLGPDAVQLVEHAALNVRP